MNTIARLALGLSLAGLLAAVTDSRAGDVSINVNGYLPAPPGVQVQVSAGRPYYVERGERVYLVRDEKRRHKKKKHHGRGYYERDEQEHGRHRGHGGR
jgi:uncharacterized protein (DUF2252 family)